jgi:hypothetical protein
MILDSATQSSTADLDQLPTEFQCEHRESAFLIESYLCAGYQPTAPQAMVQQVPMQQYMQK